MTAPVPDADLRAHLEVPVEQIAAHLKTVGGQLEAAQGAIRDASAALWAAWRELRLLQRRIAGEPEPASAPDPGGLY